MTEKNSESPFAAEVVPSRQSVRPERFQFSLQMLAGLMTAVAMGCGVVFTLPVNWLTWCQEPLWLSITTILAASWVYGRGYFKSFCLGAFIPAIIQATRIGGSTWASLGLGSVVRRSSPYPGVFGYRLGIAVGLALCVFCGLLAVAVRFIVERDRRE